MIVKACKKHGDLFESDVLKEKFTYKTKEGEKKEGFQLRCLQCRRDKDRVYKLNNPDKHKESASRARNEARRLYREGLSTERAKADIWAQQDRINNPAKYKDWSATTRKRQGQLRNTKEVCRRFEVSVDWYYEKLNKQNNLCAICNNPETRKSRTEGKICALVIDHCHKTGKLRELLCHHCNAGIGHFRDDIDLLKRAITYLETHTHV
jgi:hypothetical protein